MAPPAGSGKSFSTSAPRPWQYATSAALRIAGPRLLKKKESTRVTMNKETAKAPLPLALRFRPLPNISLPDISKNKAARERLTEMVTPVLPAEQQSTMKNEKDVITRAGPYFHLVVEALAPHVLASYNYTGTLTWESEVPMIGSRPDLILKYNGINALVLDYKGPNCIHEDELRRFGAPSAGSTKSPFSLAKQDERALVKQGVKYAQKTLAPVILFYDYDYIFALEPNQELLEEKPGVMLDVVLFREPAKSTGSQLINLEDNHVSVFLKYIVKAVSRVAT